MPSKTSEKKDGEGKKNIKPIELLVVSETKPDDKGRFYKIRVVRWEIDGVKQTPKLEKRGFYRGAKTGQAMTGDHETFNLDDTKALAANMEKVLAAMQDGLF
ncbi:MAG: hypothetical protein A2V88_09275 [Elusimicrobia bacterium RBG_16_66_12]|nr:MAG: hypothetical protein A2V88_09275 [Elusimicrobia bacterium RBG_16_66_12]